MESTTQRQAASKAAPKPQESRQSSRQGSRRPSFDAGSDPTLTTPRKGSAASVRPPSAVLGSSQALVTSSQTFGDSGSLGVPNLTSVEEGEEEDGDVPIKGAQPLCSQRRRLRCRCRRRRRRSRLLQLAPPYHQQRTLRLFV